VELLGSDQCGWSSVGRGDVGVDPALFRATLSRFASEIAVVSRSDAEGPVGFTCQSFFSVSLTPPLVAISVAGTSASYQRIRGTGRFAVTALASAQPQVAAAFALPGDQMWRGLDWEATARGNPVIRGGTMWLDCEIWDEHPVGDHLLVLGKVVEACPRDDLTHGPLLYFRSRYHRIGRAFPAGRVARPRVDHHRPRR
jgi:3-hydroxy-9,10-secoandrosta-1,3,5(10)-triene-9,17-dione monooxygenase reductase component